MRARKDLEVEIPLSSADRRCIPPLCVSTGEPEVDWHIQTFTWSSPALIGVAVATGLLLLPLVWLLRRRATIELPYSPWAWYRRQKHQLVARAGGVLLVLLFVGCLALEDAWLLARGSFLLVAVPGPLLLLFVTSRIKPHGPYAVRITREAIVLHVESPAAAAAMKARFDPA